jgi:heme exporter protein A
MNAVLEIEQLSKRFARRQVVKDVSLRLQSGEVLGVIGANGSGKSTLIKMIAGLLRPDSGALRLTVDGAVIQSKQIHEHCGLVAPYLELYDEFTPVELLQLHADLHGQLYDATRTHSLLEQFQLQDVSSRPVRGFSSGMRQRVAIVLALSLRPPLLLFDEPGVTLDEAGRSSLAQCISDARHLGLILILATNDERERELCDRVVCMTNNL